MPGDRISGMPARAERPRSALAGNPGFELFFLFEPAGHGLGLAAVAVLTDAHAVDTRGTGARRGDEGWEPFRREALGDRVGFAAHLDRCHLHDIPAGGGLTCCAFRVA